MNTAYHKNLLESNALPFLIFGLAFFFRFWKIAQLPGGLFPDEAANGLDVNAILSGNWQPFYERGNGREALFFYFLAVVVNFFGRGPWQHHIVSAAFGFAAVIAVYFLTKKLFGKNVALLAAFLMAISSYAVTLSRTAFRANTVPLLSALTLFFLISWFESKKPRAKNYLAAAAGASFALGSYTYTSFRMMLPLLVGFTFILLFGYRDKLRAVVQRYGRQTLIFLACFVIVIFPLARYFTAHPENITGRAGQVSIFSPDLNHGDVFGTFVTVFKKTMLGFFTEGDLNWRHNVSGFPFISPILAPLFALGLLMMTLALFQLIKQSWQKEIKTETLYPALCAAWFWLMLVPEILTAEGIPHGLRLVGIIPPMFIFAGWAANKVWKKIIAASSFARIRRGLAVVFVSSLLLYNYTLYFKVAALSPDYYYAFRSDLTVASQYLNSRNQKDKTYLSLDEFSVQTVAYLTTEQQQPYLLLDPARTFEVKLKTGDQVIFTQSTLFDRIKFTKAHPEAVLVKTEKNQFGELIILVYEQP
ncbi:MAG: glycosyltransferase family 39 protein [Candidatus Doudnabacteria bacterium]|nr:glycosyltransferase family 39 protein [Candidatus Doudnabacteria bacterium]